MEPPPELPPPTLLTPKPRARLGVRFICILLAPLAVMGLVFSAMDKSSDGMAMWIPALSMFGCSIACAVMVGKVAGRTTAGHVLYGALTFVGLQILYIVAFVAGCSAAVGAPNFH